MPNLPIRLALDLSGTNPAGAGGRRASQLVIDQRGVTLKIATNQSGSTLSNSSQPTLASRSNSVITLPPAVAHLVSPPTEAASSTNEIKNENVIEQSMDGGISLTFGQDGELSVCPDGSQTPFVHLKFSPQFLMTNRSRQNSLSSDQPAAISSSSAGPAHSYGHETVGNYSNLVVDLPAMINYATGAPSVDSPSFQHGSSNRRDSLHRLYTSQALVKDAHVRTVPNLHKPSNLYATRHPSLANDYKASPDSLVEPDSILIAKLKQKHVHHIDRTVPKERLSQVLGEMIMPFLLAGLGNVATGWLLFNVQTWPVFLNVPQLIILIPALLGLKGNVEMTLASRLSTHANLGDLDSKADRGKLISGNLALVQCQSSTVGFLAPMIALAISYINPDEDDILTFHEAILLMAASVITANIANLILSLVMFAVIFVCRQMDVNPDNVATPIAASLGRTR